MIRQLCDEHERMQDALGHVAAGRGNGQRIASEALAAIETRQEDDT